MNKGQVPGLRVFLITLIDLISQGKSESCASVEKMIESGVASKICASYSSVFEKNGFRTENISEIDGYYQQFCGCQDGHENRKYSCKESEGLQLIIKLALDEIY